MQPGALAISFLSDFGTRDPWVAICKGVIQSIAPAAPILDVSHDIPAFDVRAVALTLAEAVPWLTVGIHLAVVDPGVGTNRLAVAVVTARGDVLVGPDNGLLLPAADALGGVVRAVALVEESYRLAGTSATFHGRDVFAPAAAHLAGGLAPARLGVPVHAADLVRLELPRPLAIGGALATGVLFCDTFGNVKLAGNARDLALAVGGIVPGDVVAIARPGTVLPAAELRVPWLRTFGDADPGEALLYEDSLAHLCLAINRGSAAAAFEMAAAEPT